MKKILQTLSTIFFLSLFFASSAQMRQVYIDNDEINEIRKISFYNKTQAYVAFTKWIGYTQDSGRTFTKKYIGNGNVDFGNYQVNLTFGLTIAGVHALNKDTVIVYGDYGYVPTILYSVDQGNTFKLVHHSSYNNELQWGDGLKELQFPGNTKTGYAIDGYRILKTVNGGLSWTVIKNGSFSSLQFLNPTTGFVSSGNKVSKTVDGGSSWADISIPGGIINSSFFLSATKGWLNTYEDGNGKVYYTANAGVTWTLMSDPAYSSIISSKIHFTNDSTGYALGKAFTLYKTTDTGRVWERVQRTNNYEYLGYSYNDFFFSNETQFWAGGGHGYLEITTNAAGLTYPDARFVTDVSSLNSDNKVKLKNLSKKGYTYKWIKNSVLLTTDYDAIYVSDRQSIDTIKLVVTNGRFSDTATEIVDTRANQEPCKADFNYITDTSAAKFTSLYNAYGVKHYWQYGDGSVDSDTTINPVHTYSSIGFYTVKHVVFNTIDNCIDSFAQTIRIVRVTNCLQFNITSKADSFYTNALTFDFVQKAGTEAGDRPISTISWDYGDGTVDELWRHQFDSSKYYNVKLTVTHAYTGCVSSVVTPVFISMEDGCNADFRIPVKDPLGYLLGTRTIRFYSKPHSQNNITNTWTFYNRDTLKTGNVKYVEKEFYKIGNDGDYFNTSENSCFSQTVEFDLNALSVPVKHLILNNTTSCTDVDSTVFRVPTQKKVYIRANPNPKFPNIVTFNAYEYGTYGVDSFNYKTRWRVDNGYFGGYQGPSPSNSWTEFFPDDRTHNVAIASAECDGDHRREVYYMNYSAPKMSPCDIYPPDFNYIIDPVEPTLVKFFVSNPYQWVNNDLGWRMTFYFGTGDSSVADNVNYKFPAPGEYKVTLRYTNSAGCTHDVVKNIVVNKACNLVSAFSISRDSTNPYSYTFTNASKPDTTTVRYNWDFGNGDVSELKNVNYTFINAGTYKVSLTAVRSETCFSVKDTTIVIAPLCNLAANFSISRSTTNPNSITFTNKTTPDSLQNTYHWNFGNDDTSTVRNPTYHYAFPGTYKVRLIATRGKCTSGKDSSIVINNTVVSINSFSPKSGPIGTSVIISGNNFSAKSSENIVYFGDARAIVTNATLNTLSVIVPAGATYRPITVTTKGLTSSSNNPFNVTFPGGTAAFTQTSFSAKLNATSESGLQEFVLSDLNNDGRIDVVVTNNGISVYRNTGISGTVSFAPKVDFETSDYPLFVSTADINGDGKQDLVSADISSLSVLINSSTGNEISFKPAISFGIPSWTEYMSISDLNEDGKPDLAIVANGRVYILKNNSTTTINFTLLPEINGGTNAYAVSIGDLDQDGKNELAITNRGEDNISICRNTSANGNITFATPTKFPIPGNSTDIKMADIDGDDKLDLLAANASSNAVSVLLNKSAIGQISFASRVDKAVAAGPVSIGVSDLNGDGKPDILTANRNADNFSLLKNNSTPGSINIDRAIDYEVEEQPRRLSVGDLDGDGKPDIAVVIYNSSTVYAFRNMLGEPVKTEICAGGNISITSNITGTGYQWQVNKGTGFQNISDLNNYSGVNTSTLQITNLPSSWNGYQYKCVATGSSSETTVVQVLNTWTGTASTAWEDAANWSCGSVPDSNTDVVINSGTVVLHSMVTCKSLKVNAGVSFTVSPGYKLTVRQ